MKKMLLIIICISIPLSAIAQNIDFAKEVENAIKRSDPKKLAEIYSKSKEFPDLEATLNSSYLMYIALNKNNTDIIRILIDEGVNIDGNDTNYIIWRDNTPLYMAASKGNKEIVELLIDKGITPKDIYIGLNNRAGYLYYLSIKENNSMYLKLCLEYGFNPNKFDFDISTEAPIVVAIKNNNLEAFTKLIEYGARIDTVNFQNEYKSPLALSISIYGENSEFERILIDKDAYNIDYKFDENSIGYCNTKNLRIRKLPNTESEIMGLLQVNEKVEMFRVTPLAYNIDNMNFPWIEIKKNNIRGWVYVGYIVNKEIEK